MNKEYYYTIITNQSTVIASVVYKHDFGGMLGKKETLVCMNKFERKGWFTSKTYPDKKQYINAEKWAKKQLELTIRYQNKL